MWSRGSRTHATRTFCDASFFLASYFGLLVSAAAEQWRYPWCLGVSWFLFVAGPCWVFRFGAHPPASYASRLLTARLCFSLRSVHGSSPCSGSTSTG